MPTTWAKGEGAWTEFLKKPKCVHENLWALLNKRGDKGTGRGGS